MALHAGKEATLRSLMITWWVVTPDLGLPVCPQLIVPFHSMIV